MLEVDDKDEPLPFQRIHLSNSSDSFSIRSMIHDDVPTIHAGPVGSIVCHMYIYITIDIHCTYSITTSRCKHIASPLILTLLKE